MSHLDLALFAELVFHCKLVITEDLRFFLPLMSGYSRDASGVLPEMELVTRYLFLCIAVHIFTIRLQNYI